MSWEVEFTDELGAWWETLDEREQESIVGGADAEALVASPRARPAVDFL